MKVLFVSSGNSKAGVSPIVKNQGESLKHLEIDVEYFTINGKGILGYIKSIPMLSKKLKNSHYDIVHSHFLLSSLVASFTNRSPLVVSLMGSDVYRRKIWLILINILKRFRWDETIAKSMKMKEILNDASINVIPNGVNLDLFKSIDIELARKKIDLSKEKVYILFASDPNRKEKNYTLAKRALEILGRKDIELLVLFDQDNKLVTYYLNAANVILITSLYEGSPNIVKEAMACDRPIVSTDVGDVKDIIENVEGCFITSFEPYDVAEKIKKALLFSNKCNRTTGREKIISLGLDSNSIALKIVKVYNNIFTHDSGLKQGKKISSHKDLN